MALYGKSPDHGLGSERMRRVLAAIIRDYIDLARPVGSGSLVRRHGLDFSPATVRHVMADLEERGYLSQPHPSAGRIPTGKAFRYYVDSVLDVSGLNQAERDRIRRRCSPPKFTMMEILRETCRILADTSNYLGLVITPGAENMRFKHIQFVALAPFQVLAIFVTTSGVIHHKRLKADESFNQDYLDKISRYLETIVSGRTLVEIRNRIQEEIKKEGKPYHRLMERALKLGERALVDSDERELFIEGRVRIFDAPEFRTTDKAKGLLQALEEKNFLLKLLDQSLRTPGVQTVIGSEFDHHEMSECSLVATTYGSPDSPRGTLGIIGPMRMNYSRVIPLVDYTAHLLTQSFAKYDS